MSTAADAPTGKQKPKKPLAATKRSNVKFFESLADADFFSDKLTHVYFYGEVDDASVRQLREKVHAASATVTTAMPCPASAGKL